MSRIPLVALALAAAGFGTAAADAANGICSSYTREVPVASTIASSKVWANLRKQPDSVREESRRLLDDAELRLESATPPDGLCPASCSASPTPQIVFSTVPTLFLDGYSQEDKCEQLLQRTTDEPLTFERLTFDSLDKLNDWVYDFTRGKGRLGEDLYRRCDGKCSPQYVWTISRDGEKLAVDTRVTCGHARDRSDNHYQLDARLRWVCADP